MQKFTDRDETLIENDSKDNLNQNNDEDKLYQFSAYEMNLKELEELNKNKNLTLLQVARKKHLEKLVQDELDNVLSMDNTNWEQEFENQITKIFDEAPRKDAKFNISPEMFRMCANSYCFESVHMYSQKSNEIRTIKEMYEMHTRGYTQMLIGMEELSNNENSHYRLKVPTHEKTLYGGVKTDNEGYTDPLTYFDDIPTEDKYGIKYDLKKKFVNEKNDDALEYVNDYGKYDDCGITYEQYKSIVLANQKGTVFGNLNEVINNVLYAGEKDKISRSPETLKVKLTSQTMSNILYYAKLAYDSHYNKGRWTRFKEFMTGRTEVGLINKIRKEFVRMGIDKTAMDEMFHRRVSPEAALNRFESLTIDLKGKVENLKYAKENFITEQEKESIEYDEINSNFRDLKDKITNERDDKNLDGELNFEDLNNELNLQNLKDDVNGYNEIKNDVDLLKSQTDFEEMINQEELSMFDDKVNNEIKEDGIKK